MAAGQCRHCQTEAELHRRGLCWRCYGSIDIRHLYPSQSNLGNRQRGDGCEKDDSHEDPPIPPEPTEAMPSTPEIVEVMRHRDSNGYHIRHPDDGRLDERDRTPPLWRALFPTGEVYGGIFAADKSQARSELKKRLKLVVLPHGTKLERIPPATIAEERHDHDPDLNGTVFGQDRQAV
jgi:hypothetical protein